jgi:serine protease Do
VFQILTGEGTGTAFLLDERHLLTNCHVVAPYREVAVELRDRRRIVGSVRRVHPKRDLAVIEVASPIEGEVLPLAADDELESNQPVQIIGFPVGLPLSVTEGVVSNPHQLLGDLHFVQTDAAINPGNSGGPILDEVRRVVAVTTCKLSQAEMVGFGIPGAEALEFVQGFRAQAAPFGVQCPDCDVLLESEVRYCPNCGSDLEAADIHAFFQRPEPRPLVDFVERALASAGVNPVLARHGSENWSFHSGSAPIQIWSCCSEHLCFSSPLAQHGKHRLGELFRFLLSPEHAPLSFDLVENIVRLNLTIHMSDVFAVQADEVLSKRVAKFLADADRLDNVLIKNYGCSPAPKTQLTFLKEA